MSEAALNRSHARGRELALRLLSDEALAKAAAEGDADAVAVIYSRHHAALYRYCRSILHNPDDARDALQETLVKAIRGLKGREDGLPLKPWLYRIAHNESINLLRKRRPTVDLSDTLASHEDPAAAMHTRQQLRRLVDDLQELPERQRGALVMRELNGLSFEEIGAAFGITPAGAKQTVYEARVALHERTQGREMDCDDIRVKISAADRRVLRGRRVAAHLAACSGCRSFAGAIPSRRAGLAALAPPPAAGLSGGLLDQLLASEAGRGAVEGGVFAPLAGGIGQLVTGAGATTKAALAAALAIGAGAAGVVTVEAGDDPRAPAPRTEISIPAPAAAHGDGARTRKAADERRVVSRRRRAAERRRKRERAEERQDADSGGGGGSSVPVGSNDAGGGSGSGSASGGSGGGAAGGGSAGGGGVPLQVPKVDVPVAPPVVDPPSLPEVDLPELRPPKLPLPLP